MLFQGTNCVATPAILLLLKDQHLAPGGVLQCQPIALHGELGCIAQMLEVLGFLIV
jgi:hypothetical protein